MLRVALDRHDIDGVRLVGVDVDGETEIGRQVTADLLPGVAGIVAAHHVPMFLHEQHVRARRMHREVMHAVADFGIRVGDALGVQPAVGRLPGLAAIVAAEHPRGRYRNEDALSVGRVDNHGMQAHPSRPRLPRGPEP